MMSFPTLKKLRKACIYTKMPVRVKDASEETVGCEGAFDGTSTDPAHVEKKNQDFQFLLSIVKVMLDNPR